MAQVVIVSNRLPVSVSKKNSKLVYSSSIGGLATGMSSYVNNPGNSWIGWPGIASEDLTEQEKRSVIKKLATYNCYPVFLSKQQIDDFYSGYSNSVLWPLFHSMPINKNNPGQLKQWSSAYKAVNQLFADAITASMLKNSQVWVHDYQLLLLPQLLRAKQPKSSIGFFLHIPFPDINIFANFIPAKTLIKGVLGADLIGFHTPGYVHNFLAYCKKAGTGKIAGNRIYLESHTVTVGEFPMGIDYGKYASANRSKEVKQAIKRYKKKHPGLKYIVSIDRLDPTKGLIERLNAYESLLRHNPRYRGKVVFIMVAAPSRTDVTAYRNLAKKLEQLSKNINRIYGSRTWQPVDYIDTAAPFADVAALFQIADVAFIVPVRDGMNLTAKEFVASSNKRGVLILSETAGAAEELRDALIVNPEQPETLVKALEEALAMRKKELRFRLRRMKKQVAVNNVQNWAESFVDALQQPQYLNYPLVKNLNVTVTQNLYSDFGRAKKRLLLLDYDGTLVPYVNHYQDAKPPKKLLKILKKLTELPSTDVVLISGRTTDNLDSWFKGMRLSLIAEHGLSIKRATQKDWHNIEELNNQWKQLLQPVLEKYAKLTPGARVEVKPNSLAWHYRGAKPYQAQKYSVVIKKSLKPILDDYGLELLQGSKILEIKDPQISKGNAVREWLRDNYSFVLAVGDDNTDESMFRVLPAHSYSIKVGGGRTVANLRVASEEQVLELLNGLAGLK